MILRGLTAFYSVKGDYKATYDLAMQCLSLAQRHQDPVLLLGAHMELGSTLFCVGENLRALDHLEQGLALKEPRNHAFVHGQDFRVSSLCHLSTVLWSLGYADRALAKCSEAIALAQELSHPHSLAYATVYGCLLDQFCGRVTALSEKAEHAIAISRQHVLPIWAAAATIFRGWGLTRQGQMVEGINEMLRGMATWQAIGAEKSRTFFLELLAEAYLRAGNTREGLNTLEEMAVVMDKTGELFREAELHRLRGELVLTSKGLAETADITAEECFRQAAAVARTQQAKSLELRATVSLCQLLSSRGRKAEARTLLTNILRWFTEGSETEDLKQARALIERL